ncbi:MAG: hypothetical protein FJX77_01670 [Armatimonadetes bacterium]|nr:hypothetical protein [Armatimonadota bacterium]
MPHVPTRAVNPVDGAELVWVPSGEFLMGSREASDESPVRRVVISQGFWLYQSPVTNARFQEFLEAQPHARPRRAPGWWSFGGFSAPDQPVVAVKRIFTTAGSTAAARIRTWIPSVPAAGPACPGSCAADPGTAPPTTCAARDASGSDPTFGRTTTASGYCFRPDREP